jgi:altronate hydrolase
MSAAGCNLILFTTGRGTPVGGVCSPAVKVTANAKTGERMRDNIDASVGDVTEGKAGFEEGADRIYETVLSIANGQPSKSEELSHFEMQFFLKGVMR